MTIFKLRDNLYISGSEAAHDLGRLNEDGITAVLNVAYEINDPPTLPQDIFQIKVGLTDDDKNIPYTKRLAVETLKVLMLKGEKVLVHCAVGQSRSPYVAAKAVAGLENKTVGEVFNEMKELAPFVVWSPLFSGEDIHGYNNTNQDGNHE